MIRLEHINLVVSDIPQALKFYQAAFPHWQIRAEGSGDWLGKPRNWLHFGDDYNFITLNDNGVGENRDLNGHQTGLAHFAFVVSNLAALIDRLQAAGFKPSKQGTNHPFRKNVYFLDNNGFELEFVEYLSDIPSQRNSGDE
jgi:catechol 2,3-dioxygenase-like lactoylglutathione lyase family enzyme